MATKYVVNDQVLFLPLENKLSPLGGRGTDAVLNAPSCRLLVILLQKDGGVVTQQELISEVWEKHGQYVTINTLYQNISLLRKGLKKAGILTSAIRTHSKVGFSFRGVVQSITDDEITGPFPQEGRLQFDVTEVDTQNREDSLLINSYTPDLNKVIPASPPLNTKKGKVVFYLLAIFLALVTFTVFLTVKLEHFYSDKFTVEQVIVARFNHCPVYVDRGNRNADISDIIGYLKENGIKCSQDEFIYLTKNLHHEDIIVFKCSSSAEGGLKCVTRIKLPAYLEK